MSESLTPSQTELCVYVLHAMAVDVDTCGRMRRQAPAECGAKPRPYTRQKSRSQAEPSPRGRETRICANSLPAKNCTRKEVLYFPAVGQPCNHSYVLMHEADSRIDHTHCTEIFATEKRRPVGLYTTCRWNLCTAMAAYLCVYVYECARQ